MSDQIKRVCIHTHKLTTMCEATERGIPQRSLRRTAASGTVPSGAFMWAVELVGWGAKISDHRCGVFAD